MGNSLRAYKVGARGHVIADFILNPTCRLYSDSASDEAEIWCHLNISVGSLSPVSASFCYQLIEKTKNSLCSAVIKRLNQPSRT